MAIRLEILKVKKITSGAAGGHCVVGGSSSIHGIIGEDMHVELLLKYYNVPPCWIDSRYNHR